MPSCRSYSLVLLGVVLLALVVSGCGAVKPPPARDAENHIKNAGMLFTRCMQRNKGKPPTSDKELADFVKSMPRAELEAMGITDPGNALVSLRDGQPYAVNSKMDMSMMGPGQPPTGNAPKKISTKPPIALYERVGSGGKRFVVFLTGGGVAELSDEEFHDVVPHAK